MKKFIFIFALILALVPSSLWAVSGSCTQAVDTVRTKENFISFKALTFNCTWGTAGDAATDLTATVTDANMLEITGLFLIGCFTYNGATAPTALYGFVLRETVGSTADAVDIFGTAGMNRPGTAGVSSQFKPITDTTYATGGLRPVLNTLKLTASGNAVASGNAILQCIFSK